MIYLSVVIPVRNEGKHLTDTLDSLINQDYPSDKFELIIVDGMSEDNTRTIVENFMESHKTYKIKLLNNPGIWSSRARNIGIKEAVGKLIAVIDGHVYIPDDQLFNNMERSKEENNALCLARPAPLDVPGLKTGKAYWIAVARKTWLGHSKNSLIYSDHEGFVDPMSSGFAYDRSVFEKVGYFDESFDAAEDVEFNFRLKKAGIFAFTSPHFTIFSYPRESLYSLFRQQVRYGVGRARFAIKHPQGFSREAYLPTFIFLGHLLLPVLMVLLKYSKYFGLLLFMLFLFYWILLLHTGMRIAIRKKFFWPGFYISVAIWIIHVGLGWGFFKEKILGKMY